MDKNPIIVWRFEDAPEHLQHLSTNGGDEDWLAEVPADMKSEGELPMWMQSGGAFGVYRVDEFEHPDKPSWGVAIGSHG